MKALRPLTIVTLGPALLGLAIATGTWCVLPSSRTAPEVAWALLIGAAFGIIMFGPIAAARLMRQHRPDWLARYARQISWYTSALMMMSLGYLIACMRHGVFDTLAMIAFGLVLASAVVKIALGDVLRRQTKM